MPKNLENTDYRETKVELFTHAQLSKRACVSIARIPEDPCTSVVGEAPGDSLSQSQLANWTCEGNRKKRVFCSDWSEISRIETKLVSIFNHPFRGFCGARPRPRIRGTSGPWPKGLDSPCVAGDSTWASHHYIEPCTPIWFTYWQICHPVREKFAARSDVGLNVKSY